MIKMRNSKELPLNKEPYIRPSTQEAFLHSIISSSAAGDKLAEVEICDSQNWDWIAYKSNVSIENSNNSLTIKADRFSKDMKLYKYRRCFKNDSFIIKINYQQYSNFNAFIGLMIGDKVSLDINNEKGIFYLFKKTEYNKFTDDLKGRITIKNTYPIWMKIVKKDNLILSYFSYNGYKWEKYGVCNIDSLIEDENDLMIGLHVNMYENQYYNWLYTNYIQLQFNPFVRFLRLDYFVDINKNLFKRVNLFVDYIVEDLDVASNYSSNILDYIIDNINNNRYIELFLDEYYIEGRLCYKKHHNFIHPNLIYGYKKNCYFLLMGIDYNGLPSYSKIKYSDLESSISTYDNIIISDKFLPNACTFNINIKLIIKFLEDYINSRNSSHAISYIFEEIDGVFGINIYDELIKDENFAIFLNDIRIAYVIYEHKKIMYDRIDFLIAREILKEEEVMDIKDKMLSIRNKSEIIVNLVLKDRVTNRKNEIENIKKYIMELKEMETVCYEKLILIMKSKITENQSL